MSKLSLSLYFVYSNFLFSMYFKLFIK
jgi:hypothetical protein